MDAAPAQRGCARDQTRRRGMEVPLCRTELRHICGGIRGEIRSVACGKDPRNGTGRRSTLGRCRALAWRPTDRSGDDRHAGVSHDDNGPSSGGQRRLQGFRRGRLRNSHAEHQATRPSFSRTWRQYRPLTPPQATGWSPLHALRQINCPPYGPSLLWAHRKKSIWWRYCRTWVSAKRGGGNHAHPPTLQTPRHPACAVLAARKAHAACRPQGAAASRQRHPSRRDRRALSPTRTTPPSWPPLSPCHRFRTEAHPPWTLASRRQIGADPAGRDHAKLPLGR